jgi:hypothetical protein
MYCVGVCLPVLQGFFQLYLYVQTRSPHLSNYPAACQPTSLKPVNCPPLPSYCLNGFTGAIVRGQRASLASLARGEAFADPGIAWYLRLDNDLNTPRTYWPQMFRAFTEPHTKLMAALGIGPSEGDRVFGHQTHVRVGSPRYHYPLHFDMDTNWAQQLVGTKECTLFPPEEIVNLSPVPATPKNVRRLAGFPYWSQLTNPYEPVLEGGGKGVHSSRRRKQKRQKRSDLGASALAPRPEEATAWRGNLSDGDCVLIPFMWWHFFRDVPHGGRSGDMPPADDYKAGRCCGVMAQTFFNLNTSLVTRGDGTQGFAIPDAVTDFERDEYPILPPWKSGRDGHTVHIRR